MKFRIKTFSASLFVLTLFFAMVAGTNPGQAKQCVWNKAGFVLGVEWYKKSSLVNGSDGKLYLLPGKNYVQKDVFPVAQGRCNNSSEKLVAVLRAEGADWIKRGLQIGAATTVGIAGGVACALTAGTTCPVVVGAVAGIVTVAGEFIPNPKVISQGKGIFAIKTPSTTRWMDVWGTAWDPQTGPGGNI